MPVYVYRRDDGSTFELEQRITVQTLASGPTTGQHVERVMQPFSARYKGSGFYPRTTGDPHPAIPALTQPVSPRTPVMLGERRHADVRRERLPETHRASGVGRPFTGEEWGFAFASATHRGHAQMDRSRNGAFL
jgi:predicted nucleic acid-binding Zn ribbon protein